MSTTLVQAERWITLDTPLGEDILVATEVQGIEGISRLFEFTVTALSSQQAIKPADILGKDVTLSMARPGGERRLVHGIVTSLSGGGTTRSGYRLYKLVVSPALWLLDRTSDYRVFQDKTAADIVKEVLDEAVITYEARIAGHEIREYCVQFGETDLAFVQRLLAEEGYFYYFKHENQKHTLVLAESTSNYADCSQDQVAYRQDVEDVADAVYALDFGAALTDAKWSLRDYDFEAPTSPVEAESKTNIQGAGANGSEQFVYPAGSPQKSVLDRRAKVAIESTEAGFEVVHGKGTCASFTSGHRFTLAEHFVEELQDRQFVLTEVRHEAVDRVHFATRAGMEGKPYYRNSFACIPATRIARRPLAAPKPLARGPQTAVVVGPAGEDIYTDKYGRVRLQFRWDRYGKNDEKSSCFVHVAQGLAGNKWGMMFLPRIGMEVVVHFLDGDPDRPLITGAVYNGACQPPWGLPSSEGAFTKSGFLTRSTKQGTTENANELSFEDKKGSEAILFHAEKDFRREVENDDTLEVGHDQTRTIKNDRTTTIEEGNETFTVKKGNRSERLEQGNEVLEISKGNRTVTLDNGNDTLEVKLGNQTTKANAGTITLEAAQGITLKCGINTVEVTPQGIKVNGVTVTIQGTAKTEAKAPIVQLSADGMLTATGGIVKIN